MVDLETLGTGPDATVFQIAAMAFDIRTGQRIAQFNEIADISMNKSYEMVVSGETLKWWLNQDKTLLTALLNDGKGSSSELINRFHAWLSVMNSMGNMYLWGNGILFDNNILRTQMETQGLAYPVKYNRDRDVRTIVEVTCDKLGIEEKELRERYYDPSLKAHDAFNDVLNQINMVVACRRELVDHIREKDMTLKGCTNHPGEIGEPGVAVQADKINTMI